MRWRVRPSLELPLCQQQQPGLPADGAAAAIPALVIVYLPGLLGRPLRTLPLKVRRQCPRQHLGPLRALQNSAQRKLRSCGVLSREVSRQTERPHQNRIKGEPAAGTQNSSFR
jgi:hypothetical protein